MGSEGCGGGWWDKRDPWAITTHPTVQPASSKLCAVPTSPSGHSYPHSCGARCWGGRAPLGPHAGLVPGHASLPADVGVGTPVGGMGSAGGPVTGCDTVTAAMPGDGGPAEGGPLGVMVAVGTPGSLVVDGTAGLVEPTVSHALVPSGTCTRGDGCHHCCSVCHMAPAPHLSTSLSAHRCWGGHRWLCGQPQDASTAGGCEAGRCRAGR